MATKAWLFSHVPHWAGKEGRGGGTVGAQAAWGRGGRKLEGAGEQGETYRDTEARRDGDRDTHGERNRRERETERPSLSPGGRDRGEGQALGAAAGEGARRPTCVW